MAYYRLEPFGEERADLRSGIVAATVANAHRDRKKRAHAYSPQDFMPKLGLQEPKSPERMLAIVEHINRAFGGKDKRKGGATV